MKKTLFIKNAAYLTVSSLLLRFAGILFKIWLAAKIGAQGMGLYQLVFSVLTLAASFAQSGIPIAVTRLVSEEEAAGSKAGTKRIIKATLIISLVISAVSAVVLIVASDFISTRIMKEPRAALSLKIVGVSLFFTGFSSVLRGYFIARRKAAPNAVSVLLEQSVRIAAAVPAVKLASDSIYFACAAIFSGEAISGIFAFVYLYLRYLYDLKKTPSGNNIHIKSPTKSAVRIALPLCAGRYISQLLRTGENILVPRALYVYSKKGALSLFGMIKGMALPVLFFPSAVLGAVSTLLVPEMSEASINQKKLVVRAAVENILSSAAIVGFLFSAIFAAGGTEIGLLLYKSRDVGFLLTALSPIVPLMYIDSLCDGLLKGLNQQNFCFRVAVSDSAIRIVLILLLVGKTGIKGFIGIMYFSNLMTCVLNVNRLLKISEAQIDPQKTVVVPVLSAFFATLIIRAVLCFLKTENLVYIIVLCAASSIIYLMALCYFGCINPDNVRRIRTHKKYAAKRTAVSLIK
ncbi:MAG: oligosaccharide flippase family protein [Clostridia bacterium]|nr:oligosaccharide flippase family protein [Clostridia bacterium]